MHVIIVNYVTLWFQLEIMKLVDNNFTICTFTYSAGVIHNNYALCEVELYTVNYVTTMVSFKNWKYDCVPTGDKTEAGVSHIGLCIIFEVSAR